MIKLKKFLYNTINIVTVVLFTWIVSLLVIAYYVNFKCKKAFLAGNITLLIVGSIGLVIIIVIAEKIKNQYRQFLGNLCKALPVIAIVFCALQIWICYNIFFETGWDSGAFVIPASKALLNGENIQSFNEKYFVYCPNNVFLVNIYWGILKINEILHIFKGEYQLMAIVCVNCILSSFSCWLVYLITRKRLSDGIAVLTYFMALILVGFSPWMVICYSDSLTIFLPIFIIYLYSQKRLKSNFKWPLIFVLGYLGYCIKPQALIVVVAILVIEILHYIGNVNRQMLIKTAGIFVISFVLIAVISSGVNKVYLKEGFDVKSEKSVGLTHYFMMGLNKDTNGVYAEEDVILSRSCETKKERMKTNLEVAGERIKAMGPKGYFKFLSKKMLTNYDDGTFGWGAEGNFYMKVSELPDKRVASLLRAFYYNDGKYFSIYSTLVQCAWSIVVIACWIQMIWICRGKVRENKEYMVMSLALIGLTIFELLFEARARYLYIYVPVYVLVFGYGIKNIINRCIFITKTRNEI